MSPDPLEPTRRFTDRAEDYARARPDYPPELLFWTRSALHAEASWRVADLGAGTGISARVFLLAGHEVLAVEPNLAMRARAVEALGGFARFRAVDGTAEATTLPDQSVDLITAAQAFHWFDPAAARREWRRILRPGGLALVFWNERLTTGTPFLEGYDRLVREQEAHAAVAVRRPDPPALRRWFGQGLRGEGTFANRQTLDLEGLVARFFSSSYTPGPGRPGHAAARAALESLFEATSSSGRVVLEYETRAFAGEP